MVEYWKDTTTPQFEGEIWKDVPGFDGYQISNLGRARSVDREKLDVWGRLIHHKGKILRQTKNHHGYPLTVFNGYCASTHSFVMSVFVGERPEGMQVDHINSIRTDNRLENLRYCTQRENLRNPNSNIVKPILQYDLEGNFIKKWDNVKDASEGIGKESSLIVACAKGKRQSAYGYQWKYFNSNESNSEVGKYIKRGKHKTVLQYDINGEYIKNWYSAREAEITLGIPRGSLNTCLRGKTKTAHGFKWKYAN